MFFGGLSIKKDEEVLKRNCPHVVVGTPGRILALVRNRSLNLKNVKHFVLDECDKMLEQLGECLRWGCGLWRPLAASPTSEPGPERAGQRFPQSGVVWVAGSQVSWKQICGQILAFGRVNCGF